MSAQPVDSEKSGSLSARDEMAHLAAIVESSDDAIISESLDGTILTWNKAAERIFGYSAGEIIGQSILLLIPPERRRAEADILLRLQRGEFVGHFNSVRLARHGRRLDVIVSVSLIKDSAGGIVGASKILRDVTDGRHAEQAFLDGEARLRGVVDSAVDGIITISEFGIIESVNIAGVKTFGYSREELIGQNVKLLMPEPYFGEHDGYLANYRNTGQRKIIGIGREVMGRRKDGSTFPVDLAVSEVQLGDRRLFTGIVAGDITERKKAEQALLDGEARLRGVVDSAVDGIITISEQGIIESVNIAGVKTFGYSREELIGQNVKLLMPEPYFGEHDGYLANYRNTGQRKIIGIGREVMGRRKDGSTFPVDLAVSEVQLGGRRLFTGIVRDITERKEAERALVEAKERAEAASLAKEHFLSVLSHELRTPLTPVLAEMSFIEEQPDVPEDLRARLGMIRRNVETEARLVDDLLDLTRISRGKVQLRFEVVDLHDTIRGAMGMFQTAMEGKSLEITVAMRATDHHVWADPGRLQQILINLLSNAVKFTPQGGAVSIRSSNDPQGNIDIEVSDSGLGIDAEMLARLFNAFEQSNRTRRFGGLGLGLSIARSLTEMHDGMLTASSDGHDRGSTFRFSIHTVPPLAKIPAAPKAKDAVQLNQRVLLVEDHADTRAVMARLLKSLGCQVTVAGNVREAIEAAEKGTFDLLISDIGLPDGSGLDVMNHLRGKSVRGIALSGYGQEEDLRRSREAGFERHLTKPVNFNMLKEVLKPVG